MAVKTYGKLSYLKENKTWVFTELQPHVSIKLKKIFPSIPLHTKVIAFNHKQDSVLDICWFIERYPVLMKKSHRRFLKKSRARFEDQIRKTEELLSPDYKPATLNLGSVELRNYQVQFNHIAHAVKRILCGDDVGLGKTYEYLSLASSPNCLPMLVVVESHLPEQLTSDLLELFPDAKYHYINKQKVYNLPPADVYITKYSILSYWGDYLPQIKPKALIFDEVQNLRHEGTARYKVARQLSEIVDYCVGASATPIFNYGDEAFNIFDIIKPGCLGDRSDFNREWMDFGNRRVKDPEALGTFLEEQRLIIKRTRADVGRELPPVNTILHYVETDQKALNDIDALARSLAVRSLAQAKSREDVMKIGQARSELDRLLRQTTGIAKAKGIANYARIFLENKQKIAIGAWHRSVWDIILEELKDFNPQLYTGTETPKEKRKSKEAFLSDESNLFLISLRSGAGLNGLQDVCNTVIHGEFDWSPQVHHQLTGRFHRDLNEGKAKVSGNVTSIYLASHSGSDPFLIDLLGVKRAQSAGILDPHNKNTEKKHTDESRIQLLAKYLLEKRGTSYEV